MIVIIDYRAGNLTSVKRALDSLGIESEITADPTRVLNSERIIFPGVGASGKAMMNLRASGMDMAIKESFERGTPILGICLGTQIVMERSEENNTDCLGLIKGLVKRFPSPLEDSEGNRLKIPHMGWNGLTLTKNHPVLDGIDRKSEFYFVHAYFPHPEDDMQTIGLTEHGIEFTSVLGNANLFAVQFHPEKSGRPGLKILENFCRWNGDWKDA